MGELLEECLVARGETAGDGGSPHFSTLYTSSSVHVCHHYYHHRQNPLLLLLLLSTSTSTTIAVAEMITFCLTPSHADALRFVETRDILNRLWPAGRETFTHEIPSSQNRHRRSMRQSRITVPSKRLDSHRVDCSTRHTNNYSDVAPDLSLTRSTLRDSVTATEQ